MTAVEHRRHETPDSHDYPTRSYDLVKEFAIALALMTGLSLVLAGIFSSPDDPSITMSGWAKAAPADVVSTAAGELAGTTTTATNRPPDNRPRRRSPYHPGAGRVGRDARAPADRDRDGVRRCLGQGPGR